MLLFRRGRRRLLRRRLEPALDLTPVDRLGELVDRVIALLEQPRRPERRAPEARSPEAPPPPPRPRAARREPQARAPASGHCVLFVGGPAGYRLVDFVGSVPAAGERLVLDGRSQRVLRLGPSPLPGDTRRCAFLEPR